MQGGNAAGFGEVQYFCQLGDLNGMTEAVALISVFSSPDDFFRQESSGALLVCTYRGNTCLRVISVQDIKSCVAMVPFKNTEDGKFYVCEKMGLEIAYLGGAAEPVDAE